MYVHVRISTLPLYLATNMDSSYIQNLIHSFTNVLRAQFQILVKCIKPVGVSLAHTVLHLQCSSMNIFTACASNQCIQWTHKLAITFNVVDGSYIHWMHGQTGQCSCERMLHVLREGAAVLLCALMLCV